MKLMEANSHTCQLCLEAKVDPNRDDGFCKDCGDIVDRYGGETEREEYLVEDDCEGCK